ncbi:MAG: ABC transporter permease, partial [Acidobacteriota bacterium]
ARSAPADAMRGGRGVDSLSQRHGLRRARVVLQIALSMVLLVGALLFGQSLDNLLRSETGLDSDGVLMALVRSPSIPPDRRVGVFEELEERFGRVPGVESAAAVIFSPFGGTTWNQSTYASDIDAAITAWFNRVGPDYFATFKTPLLAGRAFTAADRASSAKVAIVNERLARELYGEESPIGRRLRYEARGDDEDPSFEIVGVVADTKYTGLRDEMLPFAYLPTAQEHTPMPFMGYILRLRGSDGGVRSGIQEQMAKVDAGLLVEYHRMDTMIDSTVRLERLMASLSAGFGVLAALLAALGLYGVMSYLVACRRREMGVRLALGAGVAHLVGLVASEAGRLLGLGLLAGVAGSFAVSRYAESLLYGLPANDPRTLLAGVLLLTVSAALAILVPLRRAATCDPAEVLGSE